MVKELAVHVGNRKDGSARQQVEMDARDGYARKQEEGG